MVCETEEKILLSFETSLQADVDYKLNKTHNEQRSFFKEFEKQEAFRTF